VGGRRFLLASLGKLYEGSIYQNPEPGSGTERIAVRQENKDKRDKRENSKVLR